jgi:PAS domain-containing protein
MGHFGDSSIPAADRILAAQTSVLAGALLTLVLAAQFSERRRSEAELRQSKERLQLALDGAELGAFGADLGWRWLQNGSPERLLIEWQEIDGPPVRASSQSSYGTNIIRELIPFELGGAVELSCATQGIKCRIQVPGEWVNRIADATNVPKSSRMPSMTRQQT